MSLILDQCTEYYDNRRICIAEENRKMYRLQNISGFKIQKVKVDNCFPQKIGEKRCDYLMAIDTEYLKRAIFIELKGGALNDALEQLYETIIYLKEEFRNYQVDARIVGSRDVPGFMNTPNYLKLSREIRPKGTIKRSTNKMFSESI